MHIIIWNLSIKNLILVVFLDYFDLILVDDVVLFFLSVLYRYIFNFGKNKVKYINHGQVLISLFLSNFILCYIFSFIA